MNDDADVGRHRSDSVGWSLDVYRIGSNPGRIHGLVSCQPTAGAASALTRLRKDHWAASLGLWTVFNPIRYLVAQRNLNVVCRELHTVLKVESNCNLNFSRSTYMQSHTRRVASVLVDWCMKWTAAAGSKCMREGLRSLSREIKWIDVVRCRSYAPGYCCCRWINFPFCKFISLAQVDVNNRLDNWLAQFGNYIENVCKLSPELKVTMFRSIKLKLEPW